MKAKALVMLVLIAARMVGECRTEASVETEVIPIMTYPFSDPDPVPSPQARYYPYFRYDGSTTGAVVRSWRFVVLDNGRIRVRILPEVGGKVWSATDKVTGRDFLYCNHVMKFRDVAMRGPWVSGGIEFNFGIIGHTPTSSTPVDWIARTNSDGSVSCFVGADERISRTFWQVEIRLAPGQDWFETRTGWFNSSGLPAPLYQWMNAAYSVRNDPEFIFPGNDVVGHEGEITTRKWPLDDVGHRLDRYSGNAFGGPKSYHVLPGDNGYYAVWWPDLGFGSYHRNVDYEKFGRKIWLWALSREGGIWEDLLTDDDGQYAELQSGLCFNQPRNANYRTPFKHPVFSAGGTMCFAERWGPLRSRKELDSRRGASEKIARPVDAPADFDWDSAWGHYVRGEQYVRERHDREGADEFRKALAADPFLVPALGSLAAYEFRRGNYGAVHENCRRALAVDGYDAKANYLDGFAYFVQGDQTTARERLGVAALDMGWRSAALALVARGFLREGRQEEALSAARKSRAANEQNLDAILSEIIALRGRPDCEKVARKALVSWPLFHAARYELNRVSGTEPFQDYVRNEQPDETYLEMGSWYEETGLVEDANRLFSLAEQSIVAKIRLGEFDSAQGLPVAGVCPFRRETLPALRRAAGAGGWKGRYLLSVLLSYFDYDREADMVLEECGQEPDESVFYQFRATRRKGDACLADLRRAQKMGDSWRVGRQLANFFRATGDDSALVKELVHYNEKYQHRNPLEIAYAQALLKMSRYSECLRFLSGVFLLPSEHADAATSIWQEAQKALGLELTWPENLGRGEPYPDSPVAY